MKKRINIILISALILTTLQMNTQPVYAVESQYQTVEVTGFNEDLIAENSDGLSASTSTTKTFDAVTGGANNVMYSTAFRGPLNPTTAPAYGLPVSGTINSLAYPGVTYQLEDYNKDNALLLIDDEEGQLTLKTSGSYEKLIILASSASGASTFSAVLNFSDGTSYSTSFSVSDWYNGTGYAIKGIGRVARDGSVAGLMDGFFDETSENPRLYDCFIDVSAYKTKLITSISIEKTSLSGRTAILAVAGQKPAGAPVSVTSQAAATITDSSFTANWDSVAGATSYNIDVSTDTNFTNLVSGYNNLDVGNVTSYAVSGLSTSTTYYYRVRAVNGSGVGFSSDKITVTTTGSSVSTTPTVSSTTTSGSSTVNTGIVQTQRQTNVNGINELTSELLTTVDITRTQSADKITDTVILNDTKTDEILSKVTEANKDTVQVYIDDVSEAPADEINITLKQASVSKISQTNLDLEIKTQNVEIYLTSDTLDQISTKAKDLYFRIVPLKDSIQKEEAVTNAISGQLIIQAAGTNEIKVLGMPMTIETNYANLPAKVVFSLKGIEIPEGELLQREFLKNFGVSIIHSNNEQELQKGTIVYDEDQNPVGIEITIDKFSTFTMVQFDNLSEYLYNTHMMLGLIGSKSYAYKVAGIIESDYDSANVVVLKKGKYYRVLADFANVDSANSACQDLIKKQYIIHYYFYNK